jgi:hypothetical protein
MTDAELEALRAEFRSVTVGPRIFSTIRGLTRALAGSLPPAVYSETGQWDDEGISAAVQLAFERELLSAGGLQYAFDVAATIGDFRALVSQRIRAALVRARRRTVIDNLLDRSMSVLRDGPFQEVRKSWRPDGSQLEVKDWSESEVRAACGRIATVPTVRAEKGERAPSVYTTASLGTCLERIFEDAPAALGRRDLGRIFETTLTVWRPTLLGLDEGPTLAAPADTSPERISMMSQTVDLIEQALDPVEGSILDLLEEGATVTAIAQALRVSRPTAYARMETLYSKLGDLIGDLAEADASAVLSATLARRVAGS